MIDILKEFVSGNFSLAQVMFIAIVSIIVQLLSWGVKELWSLYKNSRLPNEHDLQVWNRIQKHLDNDTLQFIKKQHFGNSFDDCYMKPLETLYFITSEDFPDYQFIEKKLAISFTQVTDSLKDFFDLVNTHVFYCANSMNFRDVPLSSFGGDEGKRDETIKTMNKSANDLHEKIIKFMKESNYRFNNKLK